MDKSIHVGKIHPAFFKMSPFLTRFKKEYDGKTINLKSPFFNLTYESGSLIGDDSDVLADFRDIIAENYGNKVSRDRVYKMINWKTVPNNINVVNVGVCILSDDFISGWDGKINTIWYDKYPPGEIIETYFKFWVHKKLHDAHKMTESQVLQCDKDESLPNLIFAKLNKIGDIDQLDGLIKTVLSHGIQ